ncbi:MAG: hypothetical protein AUJ32_00355 [Parcubacteria group bacterium CG1_02_40_82]|uniref:YdbS-like PH domain-containing protein n=4 Tax=Candidatus Portnoyibacteriota TaxID=1817913 RepID=A0A2M7IHG8_9BACT|nr:MAG: hypothetical protein AUJ32_00355 [Parcubacteria group bacterium CG1_02_40_82]PIQ75400.1 MAG: hypothetical protein COV84_01320 [Candidatus Portnoybacteria bacterium CG11_big_fil_rev_8_21_14_0_20_40_15]PIW75977.1 MAG: hypothetical protein CO001_03780 [Candidatus Portnoybacteria bacterium CG_4_8_14_3_um_filter_40_10]PIY74459.1 MAG: hypothetical protein COY85_03120 [Candidatus Portnoybacteria bacterium CG_4_10_14_0_8_um_filter_40_50]PJA64822.1 MAG: hypothetical protein CO159_00910 [Candidat
MPFVLKQDEKVILVLHRHWLVLSLVLLRVIPLFFLPLLVWLVLSRFIGTIEAQELLVSRSFWLFSSLWWLFLWASLATLWVNYYLDYWIITNQRLISTYQNGLFRREVSELNLTRIQDLSVNVKGVLETFFNYGDLEIRTAGTFENRGAEDPNVFIFKDIGNPYQVQNTLSKIHHDFLNKSRQI